MAKVRLYGETSGYVDLKAPDVAGDVTITLPNATGPFALESYVDAAVAAIPSIAGIGSNVVQTVKTNTFSTTATTYGDVTGLTATITPTTATSKVLIIAHVSVGVGPEGAQRDVFLRLSGGNSGTFVGDAASGLVQAAANTSGDNRVSFTYYRFWSAETEMIVHLDSPASTSATTYAVQMRVRSGATGYVNRSGRDVSGGPRTASSLTVIEVAP